MKKTIERRDHKKRSERGSATIEFLVILPIFLGALAISFEFGHGLWAHQIVTKGVRDATRYLARVPLTATNIAYAQNLAETGSITGTAANFPWSASATVTINQHALDYSSSNFRRSGSVIEIEAKVPVTLTMLNFFGMGTAVTLDVKDQARWIGE
jgi:Flp pilus assembly protein TadG